MRLSPRRYPHLHPAPFRHSRARSLFTNAAAYHGARRRATRRDPRPINFFVFFSSTILPFFSFLPYIQSRRTIRLYPGLFPLGSCRTGRANLLSSGTAGPTGATRPAQHPAAPTSRSFRLPAFRSLARRVPPRPPVAVVAVAVVTMSTLEEFYRSIPPVTRTYVTLSVLTTAACALELASPLKLYLSWARVPAQPWRLLTAFLYFGAFGVDFLFHMFFLSRYSRLLEETSFRGRTAEFAFFLLLAGALLVVAAPLFTNVLFLGPSLTFCMVYLWSRRNEAVTLSFLGVLTFKAPYLPWMLLAFSALLGTSPAIDLLGMAVGHVYYFAKDVYPELSGRSMLATPRWFASLFGGGGEDEDGGGGFARRAPRRAGIGAEAAAAGNDEHRADADDAWR